MKKLMIAIFVTSLLIVGCDFSVQNYEINGYAKKCKDHGGIGSINNITRTAQCMDGTKVKWK